MVHVACQAGVADAVDERELIHHPRVKRRVAINHAPIAKD
jgi:hypothetical protein